MIDWVQNVKRNIDLILLQIKIPCESLETISKWKQHVYTSDQLWWRFSCFHNEKPKIASMATLLSLCEKCANTELFLVRIFLHSDWIRRFTHIFSDLLVFSPNTGKCGPEITPYLHTFHTVREVWPLMLFWVFHYENRKISIKVDQKCKRVNGSARSAEPF